MLIRTAAAPIGTVSAVAGAMIGPEFGAVDEKTTRLIDTSDRQFRFLAADPATGVWSATDGFLSSDSRGSAPVVGTLVVQHSAIGT